ncbi:MULTISPECIES: hypothetical protein [unclassified Rhizobium]|uniref:hypothetical protein n=1 Tax=unclassified Rhizobium TaxID=2613769 RepID=UPI0012DF7190|nr:MULTISPECIES: hypothetical protein [unclassified Rhizobium]
MTIEIKTFSKAEIEQLRADTPGVSRRIHLNNAGAALMPVVTAVTADDVVAGANDDDDDNGPFGRMIGPPASSCSSSGLRHSSTRADQQADT